MKEPKAFDSLSDPHDSQTHETGSSLACGDWNAIRKGEP